MSRFATAILAQHSIAMLEQCCNPSKQCCSNVAMLHCAKNRCYELSRVTQTLKKRECKKKMKTKTKTEALLIEES